MRTLLTPTSPFQPCVSLDAQLKPFLAVDFTNDDGMIAGLLEGVSERAERETGHALVSRTWEYQVWSGDESGLISIDLPLAPVTEIASVTLYDVDDVDEVLEVGDDGYRAFDGHIRMTRSLGQNERLVVVFDAGYANAYQVPVGYATAVMQAVSWAYTHRGETDDPHFLSRLRPWRRVYA